MTIPNIYETFATVHTSTANPKDCVLICTYISVSHVTYVPLMLALLDLIKMKVNISFINIVKGLSV